MPYIPHLLKNKYSAIYLYYKHYILIFIQIIISVIS